MNNLDIKRLDHHGIVAGVFDNLGFQAMLDEFIGFDDQEGITPGQAVKALVIAGMGFANTPLMLTPRFFENLPVDRLVGEGVTADMLNRHKFGRVLDRIHQKGCSAVFSLLAAKACSQEHVDCRVRSLDSTSFCVTGEYDEATDTNAIELCHGHSKDHRPDLKQMVTELVVSQDGGIPVELACHDGNKADTEIFKARTKHLVDTIASSEPLRAWVADSKLYTHANAKSLAQLPFVTRIPRTIAAENQVVEKTLATYNDWNPLPGMEGYRYQKHVLTHYGIAQRWLVVCSDSSKIRSESTIRKAVQREREKLDKALAKFQKQTFSCKDDGEKDIKKLLKGIKYHHIEAVRWEEIKKFDGRGRPPATKAPSVTGWQGSAQIRHLDKAIDHDIEVKACFTIGTSIPEDQMNDQEVIQTYKGQAAVEGGFRFLKDPIFFTSSFFLKKTSRIEALLTVMAIALLVYSIAQRRLRANMERLKETIPNQIGSPSSSPTLRWVFQSFTGVNVVRTDNDTLLHGVTPLRERIIRLFEYKPLEAIYQITGAGG